MGLLYQIEIDNPDREERYFLSGEYEIKDGKPRLIPKRHSSHWIGYGSPVQNKLSAIGHTAIYDYYSFEIEMEIMKFHEENYGPNYRG
jgi:hypothetical protein